VNTGTDDHHPDHGNGSGVGATDRDREPAVVAGDPARNAGDLLEASRPSPTTPTATQRGCRPPLSDVPFRFDGVH